MRKISKVNWTRFGATAAAMLLAASAGTLLAQAQSKYANDTITIVTNGGGRADLHVSGSGNHCSATTSADHAVAISIGDDLCEAWDTSGDTPSSLYAKITANKISFRQGGKTYVISDTATVNRARAMFAPIEDLAGQQFGLGAKQRALGEKQRALGEQEREVKVQVPDMSADFAKVEADAKRLSTEGGTQSELGDLQSELGDLQSRLGDLQSQAGDQQSKFGDQQSTLGDQQSALGDQQSKLGDQSQRMAQDIASKLRAMLNQSIQNGTAKSE